MEGLAKYLDAVERTDPDQVRRPGHEGPRPPRREPRSAGGDRRGLPDPRARRLGQGGLRGGGRASARTRSSSCPTRASRASRSAARSSPRASSSRCRSPTASSAGSSTAWAGRRTARATSPPRPSIPAVARPPDALTRKRITRRVVTGVRSIDGLIPLGRGQRIGIFAGSGVGKSTIMGMIARNTDADVNVIALIGERGREVREFIENDLGEEGLAALGRHRLDLGHAAPLRGCAAPTSPPPSPSTSATRART